MELACSMRSLNKQLSSSITTEATSGRKSLNGKNCRSIRMGIYNSETVTKLQISFVAYNLISNYKIQGQCNSIELQITYII